MIESRLEIVVKSREILTVDEILWRTSKDKNRFKLMKF